MFTRGPTSRRRLTIDWHYPVAPLVRSGGTSTYSASELRPVDRTAAFAAIAAGDPRPLLVLRECENCAGTDDALLGRRLANERTILLASWFRCVKLPADVVQDEHPFRILYGEREVPHLILAQADGSGAIPLAGMPSQTALWLAMEKHIRGAYELEPRTAVRDWGEMLNRLDELDGRRALLRERLERAVESGGEKSDSSIALARELRELEAERDRVLAEEALLRDLKPKTSPKSGG